MKNLHNLSELHIHFIGIGGISMSGLAKLMLHKGIEISGSDTGQNKEIDYLISQGVQVYHSHKPENINEDIDIVVYTGAIKLDNPELKQARLLNIETMERSEFLGLVAKSYNRVIAVSGTHGKTTTTAMLGLIMQRAGLEPTIHIGGESINLDGNTILGGNEYFLVEACEYRESFRYLMPYIGVITNIELDHLDYYSDYNSIYNAFARFASNSENLVTLDDIKISHNKIITIGNDWVIKDIEYLGEGYYFNVYYKSEYYETFRLNLIGLHNVTNALFAIAVAHSLGISKDIMVEALSDFVGVERRYERIARLNNCNLLIDYAHHPTELKASIEGIEGVYKKILYVFQPHTYSRTLKLFDEFVEVFNVLENVIIYKTYPARESLLVGGTAMDLYNGITVKKKSYLEDLDDLIDYFESNACNYDCILVLGAGDLADRLKDYYTKKN